MRATLVQMQAGECVVIPMRERASNSVRNCACLLGLEMDRKYTVKVDRVARTCKVTRLQ